MNDSDDTNQLTLLLLPVEILTSIFCQLDPAGLIATSQTCTYFRTIIKPSKKHFAERLLALELEEEHGGIIPTFRSRDNALSPDWNEASWDEMRWACTHCLRLLHHASFDNHALLRLKFRKSMPGSEAAHAITSWEPVERKALTAKQQRERELVTALEKRWNKEKRLVYHQSVTSNHNDEIAHSYEMSWTGTQRHRRRCNECRFQLGYLKRTAFRVSPHAWAYSVNKGTVEIPIVKSRRLNFATPLDRYFPGVSEYLEAPRVNFKLPLFRIYREKSTYQPNTMHMVRCPGCTVWQELRAFRWGPVGWGYGEFFGIGIYMTEEAVEQHFEHVRNMRCNRCFMNEHGREKLAQELHALFKRLISNEQQAVQVILSSGWVQLKHANEMTNKLVEHRGEIKQLIKSLEATERKWDKLKPDGQWTTIDVESKNIEDNMALMNTRRLECIQICVGMPELVDHCKNLYGSFEQWYENWDDAVGYWKWTKVWKEEVEREPEILVKWALERDPKRVC